MALKKLEVPQFVTPGAQMTLKVFGLYRPCSHSAFSSLAFIPKWSVIFEKSNAQQLQSKVAYATYFQGRSNRYKFVMILPPKDNKIDIFLKNYLKGFYNKPLSLTHKNPTDDTPIVLDQLKAHNLFKLCIGPGPYDPEAQYNRATFTEECVATLNLTRGQYWPRWPKIQLQGSL